jgi:hypothetical protein
MPTRRALVASFEIGRPMNTTPRARARIAAITTSATEPTIWLCSESRT